MVHVNFTFNFGIYRTFIEAGKENVCIDEGYAPLLEQLDRHPGIKANLFIEGVTLKAINERRPDLIRLIRKGIDRNQLEIGTYTFNHPVLTLIPYEDCYRQIEEGVKANREILGVNQMGFMLPEQAWDPSMPKILEDLGIQYLIIGGSIVTRDYPDLQIQDLHKPCIMRGIFSSKVVGLSMTAPSGIKGDDEYYVEGGIVQGPDQNVMDFRKRVDQLKACAGDENVLMLCKNDAEFVYEMSLASIYGRSWDRNGYGRHMGESIKDLAFERAARMGDGWARMEQMADIRFVTVGEFVAANKPAFDFILKPSGRKDYTEWLDGSEKVDYMWCEARNEIKTAEYTLLLARKMGFDTAKSQDLLHDAWLKLLKAEISTGRRACAHAGGKATRVYVSMEDALDAKNLARKSVEILPDLRRP